MPGMWVYLAIAIAAVVVKVVLIATGHWPLAPYGAGDQPPRAADAQGQRREPGCHPHAVRQPQRDQAAAGAGPPPTAAAPNTASVTRPAMAR